MNQNRIKILVFLITCMFYTINNTSLAMDKLGRLFTLPNERSALDKWRIMKPKPPELSTQIDGAKEGDVQKLETPDFITFDGIIVRRGRPPIIWLNGNNNSELKGFGIDTQTIQYTALPIFLHELSEGENPRIVWSKEAIYLKPGQILDTKNNTIIEKYEIAKMADSVEKIEPVLAVAQETPKILEKQEENPSFFGTVIRSIFNTDK